MVKTKKSGHVHTHLHSSGRSTIKVTPIFVTPQSLNVTSKSHNPIWKTLVILIVIILIAIIVWRLWPSGKNEATTPTVAPKSTNDEIDLSTSIAQDFFKNPLQMGLTGVGVVFLVGVLITVMLRRRKSLPTPSSPLVTTHQGDLRSGFQEILGRIEEMKERCLEKVRSATHVEELGQALNEYNKEINRIFGDISRDVTNEEFKIMGERVDIEYINTVARNRAVVFDSR